MKVFHIVGYSVVLVCALVMGWAASALWGTPTAPDEHVHAGAQEQAEQRWTCPMHPQIVQPKPGKCPLCGMDLVLQESGEDDAGPRTLVMSESDKKLAEVVTAPVERRFAVAKVHMVGKVDYDETRVKTISAWVPGRLDRLYVDYTGIPVRKGDHLVWLYSPDFMTAQEELLEAMKQVALAAEEASEFLRQSNVRALKSAREKLRLWGLTAKQISELEERGTVEDHVLITSPMKGIVIHKSLNEGDYVQTGTAIYRIADLTHLWVRLDAYESDLPWLRYGQKVSIETEAYPGEIFKGWISFIDPVLDQRTQTVKVRVNVENTDGKLKPGMFVRARLESRVAQGGMVMDPGLRHKWICPMHPEVVEDGEGACRICGMDLVRPADLGLVVPEAKAEKPLVVPTTAVLITGRRAVVYVQVPGKERPTFEGREVVLGPRAGDHYLVLAGLEEGEEVVVNGNFKIDSALQILAKPSMMSMPADPGPLQGKELLVFRQKLAPIYKAYFTAHRALAADDAGAARPALAKLAEATSSVDTAALSTAKAKESWRDLAKGLQDTASKSRKAKDLDATRAAFEKLSAQVLRLEKTFGHAENEVYVQVHCSMAFGEKGAAWLQPLGKVENPYFGSSMLRCGDVVRKFPGRGRKVGNAGLKPRAKIPRGLATALAPVYDAYQEAQVALASDMLKGAKAAFTRLGNAVKGIDMGLVKGKAHMQWMQLSKDLEAAAKTGTGAKDLKATREAFRSASTALIAVETQFGHGGTDTYYEIFCSMAFDGKGAAWLQKTQKVRNPYYGKTMLGCGEVKKRHAATIPKPPAAGPKDFKAALSPVYAAYLEAQEALAQDTLAGAKAAFTRLGNAVKGVDMGLVKGPAHMQWMQLAEKLETAAKAGTGAKDLKTTRNAFRAASTAVISIEKQFGHGGADTYHEVFCSMAFDGEGAAWLQKTEKVRNPYYGKSMLGCGEVTKRHAPAKGGR